jgi:hypothetical protein
MDPRVKTPAPELARLHEMSLALYDGILEANQALQDLRTLRAEVKKKQAAAAQAGRPAEVTEALALFDKKAAELEGGAGAASGAGGGPGGAMGAGGPGGQGAGGAPDTLAMIGYSLNSLMSTLQASETESTTQLAAAVAERLKALRTLLERFKTLKTRDLAGLNEIIRSAGL